MVMARIRSSLSLLARYGKVPPVATGLRHLPCPRRALPKTPLEEGRGENSAFDDRLYDL